MANRHLDWDEKGEQKITYNVDDVKSDLKKMSGEELWNTYTNAIDVVTVTTNHPKVRAREITIWHYAGEEIQRRLTNLPGLV